jgi:hypothetical protein
VEARVERAIAAHLAEVVELREPHHDEREERLRIPLIVEEDVRVAEHLLVEQVRLVEEEDQVEVLLGEVFHVRRDGVEDGGPRWRSAPGPARGRADGGSRGGPAWCLYGRRLLRGGWRRPPQAACQINCIPATSRRSLAGPVPPTQRRADGGTGASDEQPLVPAGRCSWSRLARGSAPSSHAASRRCRAGRPDSRARTTRARSSTRCARRSPACRRN